MEIVHALQPLPQGVSTAIAMGFFDGVHLGHRQVVEAARQVARAQGLSTAVFTFALPFSSTMKGKRLLDYSQKQAIMEALGVEYYLSPAFEEFSGFSPEDFVEKMLAGMYHAKAIFCGENFTFGKRAAGNVSLLRQLCAPLGIEVHVVPLAEYQGEPVSSTRIRRALESGDVAAANAMLGTPYRIAFPVLHGKALGRTLGMPTINQHYPEGFQLPKFGIYVTRVYLDGHWWPAATGLGTRPTVNDDPTKVSCETFIPGYEGDLYGREVLLEFHRYLEPSHRFGDVSQLRQAVMDWAKAAVEYFA